MANDHASAIEVALNYDALSEAERITGAPYDADKMTGLLGLGLHMHHRARKNAILANARDTNSWNQTLGEWMAVIEDMGFRLVLTEDIPGTDDKYRIWWRDGVLLSADSYSGDKTVNGAKAVFNYHGPRDAMHSCSSGWLVDLDGTPVWDASRDAREGFRFAVNKMEASGRFLPKWHACHFLWLLHYGDTKQEGYDYEAITAARVERLPAEVRAAICVG